MSRWNHIQWIALGTGILALLIVVVLGITETRQALLAYLFAFLFFTGLSAGSLALLMIHRLTGGAWGYDLRAPLLAAARVLPLQTLLVLPLLFGVTVLYPWAEADALARDELLHAQRWYLNPPFFIARALLYFALWNVLLMYIARRGGNGTSRSAAVGLIVYALTTLFAATDWAMSLQPQWRSTAFGLLVATAWLLSATALAIVCAPLQTDSIMPRRRQDLGNLLLLLVLAWSYLAFMDYLTVWSGDLPPEIAWYIPRTLTSWRWLAWFLIAFQFALPFAALLTRRAKQRPLILRRIAALVLIAGLGNAFWLVVPGLRPQGFALHWMDVFAPLGIGALWLCIFLHHLGGRGGPLHGQFVTPTSPEATLTQAESRRMAPPKSSAAFSKVTISLSMHTEGDRD